MNGECYFPALFQGEYVTQSTSSSSVSSSKSSLSKDSLNERVNMNHKRHKVLSALKSVEDLQNSIYYSTHDGTDFAADPSIPSHSKSPDGNSSPISSSLSATYYDTMNIYSNSIPVWGHCHLRLGSNVILRKTVNKNKFSKGKNSILKFFEKENNIDISGKRKPRRITRSRSTECFKCFRFELRSSNVVQVYTKSLQLCHTSEEKAVRECPTDLDIKQKTVRQIVLYRTKGYLGEPAGNPTYCPINGVYTFGYSTREMDRTTTSANGCGDAHLKNSDRQFVSDCPYSFGLNFKFSSKCSAFHEELNFHCLGDWDSGHGDGSRYIALMDTNVSQNYRTRSTTKPRYRCGMYKNDPITGQVEVALSSDSTCLTHLKSATNGFETFKLKPLSSDPITSWASPFFDGAANNLIMKDEMDRCSLPEWGQGVWQDMTVVGGSIMLKDKRQFKTFTAKCIRKSSEDKNRFLMLSKNECGQEKLTCVWFKYRGIDTIEYQIGLYSTPATSALTTLNSNIDTNKDDLSMQFETKLCGDSNFQDRTWTTQGRKVETSETPYPIVGEYSGVIPDTSGEMCARMYSDCNNPQTMFYTIFNCLNRSQIYEEREYICLGEWVEDGLIYTYTKRKDLSSISDGNFLHECFVGLLTAQGDVYIKEAGSNCERGQNPLKTGMRLSQVNKCYDNTVRRRYNNRLTRLEMKNIRNPSMFDHWKESVSELSFKERQLFNMEMSGLSHGSYLPLYSSAVSSQISFNFGASSLFSIIFTLKMTKVF